MSAESTAHERYRALRRRRRFFHSALAMGLGALVPFWLTFRNLERLWGVLGFVWMLIGIVGMGYTKNRINEFDCPHCCGKFGMPAEEADGYLCESCGAKISRHQAESDESD